VEMGSGITAPTTLDIAILFFMKLFAYALPL
jgi:hypothetical protein